MLDGLLSHSIDVKGIVAAIVGAIVGAVFKWLLDRREKARLRADIIAQEAETRRFHESLDATNVRLAAQETQNAEKQRELDRLCELLQGKGVDIEQREDRLTKLLATLRDNETTLWAKFDRRLPFDDYHARIGRKKPYIITLANLKGGVGKTTLTANLLVYFDKLRLKVLAIDLDYQGSLTTMLRSYGEQKKREFGVNKLFLPGAQLGTLMSATRSLGSRLPHSRLAPAFYAFARYEDFLMVEWLLQQGNDDVRYRLARLLLQDEVANEFDVILIDVAPRMTTGTVNALCASTHVLVPTIFNPLSAEPVQNFVRTAKNLMDTLSPKLEFLGIVETMSPPANQGQAARAEGKRIIAEGLKEFPGIGILQSMVPRQPAIADSLAALTGNRATRGIFVALGREIYASVKHERKAAA
jgi:chromosome partitioning protein